jgi:hypothetical protein
LKFEFKIYETQLEDQKPKKSLRRLTRRRKNRKASKRRENGKSSKMAKKELRKAQNSL